MEPHKEFTNPWWDRRNELSPRVFVVSITPVESYDVIDFYEYQGTILGVVNAARAGGKGEDRVVTQCVTIEGAKRHLFGVDNASQ